ncbi:transposase, partial [Glaesserella parasuis]|uniref:transposase n=1 Tax=Glaesserella parasuis TaxID=738 RepID=UPI0013667106
CIVHLVRNSLKFVSWKDYKAVTADLKQVYQAPTDDSVFKVIWLAIKDASKKWTMPIQNWKLAMNRFMIDFGDRLDDHR